MEGQQSEEKIVLHGQEKIEFHDQEREQGQEKWQEKIVLSILIEFL
jgi:hypothetical protein